jgi:WD40 repeat protein
MSASTRRLALLLCGLAFLRIGPLVRAASPLSEAARSPALGSAITTLTFSPDGKIVACGTADDRLRLWTIGDSGPLAPGVAQGGGFVTYVQRHPRAPWRLLAVGRKGMVDIFDPQTMRRDDWISQKGGLAAVTPDTRSLATADPDLEQPIHLWNLGAEIPSEAGSTLPRLEGVGGKVNSLVLGPKAGWIVLAGVVNGGGPGLAPEGFVLFWDRHDDTHPRLEKENSAVLGLAASSDRTRVAAVGYEGEEGVMTNGHVSIWDTATKRRLLDLPVQPDNTVRAAAFQPGSSVLATVGSDGRVRLWNADNARMLAMEKVGGPATAVAFAADGKRLAVGTEGGEVVVMDVALP